MNGSPSAVTVKVASGRIADEPRCSLRVGGTAACVIVPAFQAAPSIQMVLDGLRQTLDCAPREIIVVDDGSTDDTAARARECGATVVVCSRNRGKGEALLRGFETALALGYGAALTVDADGQHPPASAALLLTASENPQALVLGIRDLARAGAPRKNQLSNRISNFFLSVFTGRRLRDTQCGLRRYPISETLALRAKASGYAFEAEVILRASAAGIEVVEQDVAVYYPPESQRVTHFNSVRDPIRIAFTVVRTLHDLRRAR